MTTYYGIWFLIGGNSCRVIGRGEKIKMFPQSKHLAASKRTSGNVFVYK